MGLRGRQPPPHRPARLRDAPTSPSAAAQALASTWERRQAKHLALERIEAAGSAAGTAAPGPAWPAIPELAAPEAPLDLDALRAERDALVAELCSGGPPDPAREQGELGAKAEQLRAEREHAGHVATKADEARADIGCFRLLRRAGLAEEAHSRDMTAEARARERALPERWPRTRTLKRGPSARRPRTRRGTKPSRSGAGAWRRSRRRWPARQRRSWV